MNVITLKRFFTLVNLALTLVIPAQGNKNVTKAPAVFTISGADFDKLIQAKENEIIKSKNIYINNSQLIFKSLGGDMRFLKFKLSYFPKAFLMVQVNGKDSRQIFVMSDDNSVFYKSRAEKGGYAMNKCGKEKIVAE